MRDLRSFIAECEVNAISDSQIDFSDIPEVTDEEAKDFYLANWRPKKQSVSVRIDSDILSWLKSTDPKGYQSRLNDALRWAMTHNCPLS